MRDAPCAVGLRLRPELECGALLVALPRCPHPTLNPYPLAHLLQPPSAAGGSGDVGQPHYRAQRQLFERRNGGERQAARELPAVIGAEPAEAATNASCAAGGPALVYPYCACLIPVSYWLCLVQTYPAANSTSLAFRQSPFPPVQCAMARGLSLVYRWD